MPWSGAGVFNPAVTFVPGTPATAEDQNTQDQDIAAGITNCLAKDGQNAATNNINLGNHRITNLSAGIASTDATNLGQLQQFLPTGAIIAYGGNTAPAGWLLCNGTAVSRTTYAALYGVIGTLYGVGDGSTTFNVPDYRGRALVGADNMGTGGAGRLTSATVNSTSIGGSGGFETYALQVSELASHSHAATVTDPGHNHAYETVSNTTAGPGTSNPAGGQTGALTGSSGTGITVSNANTGSGAAHLNLQPTLLSLAIIKT